MTTQPEKSAGSISLVGAGPGDPNLITVAGRNLLKCADVVVFDALANPVLLDEAPAHAQRIDVGKRGGNHKLSQDQINQLLVDLAKQGKHVVRLKGGDPYLFGRGAEELIFAAQHGVACQVVPGITSGIAAPMMAGIPVTHRQHASSVTFLTGHEDPTKPDTALDYQALAALVSAGGTLCFYMGVGKLPLIAAALAKHGLSLGTPAAAVQWGTLPHQRSVKAALGKLHDAMAEAGVASPAIIVVGPVVGLDEPGLDFFTRRPLFGQTVLVTRTRQQVSELRQQLAALGARVLEAPTIELVPPADWGEVDQTIRELHAYDWLVLTSINGVTALADRLKALGLDARHLAGMKIAAIGDATAQALEASLAIRPDLVPTRYVAESLAAELIAEHDVQGKKVLLLRADIARPALPRLLTEAGAQVTDMTIYQTKLAQSLPEEVLDALRQGEVDWVTFTSSSTARNMVEMLGSEADLLRNTRIASIGSITSDTVRTLGYAVETEANPANIAGLVAAVVAGSAGE